MTVRSARGERGGPARPARRDGWRAGVIRATAAFCVGLAASACGAQGLEVDSAEALMRAFDARGYTLDAVRERREIPPIFVQSLPADLDGLDVRTRTDLFVRIILPAAAAANRRIASERSRLESLDPADLSAADADFLDALAARYRARPDERADLLDRVDGVPVGLTIAQAADESGWGRSRFALEGNALYGQHLSAGSSAPFIEATGANVRMAVYDDIASATEAYIHTLNTTAAYRAFRALRARRRAAGESLTGAELAGTLSHYSERADDYVKTLRAIIARYRLDAFDGFPLASTDPLIVRTRPE